MQTVESPKRAVAFGDIEHELLRCQIPLVVSKPVFSKPREYYFAALDPEFESPLLAPVLKPLEVGAADLLPSDRRYKLDMQALKEVYGIDMSFDAVVAHLTRNNSGIPLFPALESVAPVVDEQREPSSAMEVADLMRLAVDCGPLDLLEFAKSIVQSGAVECSQHGVIPGFIARVLDLDSSVFARRSVRTSEADEDLIDSALVVTPLIRARLSLGLGLTQTLVTQELVYNAVYSAAEFGCLPFTYRFLNPTKAGQDAYSKVAKTMSQIHALYAHSHASLTGNPQCRLFMRPGTALTPELFKLLHAFRTLMPRQFVDDIDSTVWSGFTLNPSIWLSDSHTSSPSQTEALEVCADLTTRALAVARGQRLLELRNHGLGVFTPLENRTNELNYRLNLGAHRNFLRDPNLTWIDHGNTYVATDLVAQYERDHVPPHPDCLLPDVHVARRPEREDEDVLNQAFCAADSDDQDELLHVIASASASDISPVHLNNNARDLLNQAFCLDDSPEVSQASSALVSRSASPVQAASPVKKPSAAAPAAGVRQTQATSSAKSSSSCRPAASASTRPATGRAAPAQQRQQQCKPQQPLEQLQPASRLAQGRKHQLLQPVAAPAAAAATKTSRPAPVAVAMPVRREAAKKSGAAGKANKPAPRWR